MSLVATCVTVGSQEYAELMSWRRPAEPFYAAQVFRVLEFDVPQMAEHRLQLYIYRNRDEIICAFSTIQITSIYDAFTGGLQHVYWPVLGVHPDHQGQGYAKEVLNHLINLSEDMVNKNSLLSDAVFLDVYTANVKAIDIYKKRGFFIWDESNPLVDLQENNETYYVMAKLLR